MTRPGAFRRALAALVGVTGLAAAALPGRPAALSLAGTLLVAGVADEGLGLRDHVMWILGAAVAGGAAGWGGATLAAPQVRTIALGFGIAVGGGFGAVARSLAAAETTAQSESVTVDATEAKTETPEPRPVDLFEDHPDPVLYVEDAGEGPVVRAANAAFEETFGVGTEAVENAALADALMATDRVADVVDAVADAGPFDAIVTCETAGDPRPFRLRTVALGGGAATRGYVLYTPVGDGET